MVLLNPVFNCFNNLLSFSADKATTETYNFVSFTLNVALVGGSIAGRPTPRPRQSQKYFTINQCHT